MTWYVVQTNPQNERKAAGELRRAGIHTYMPKRSIVTTHRRTKEASVRHKPLLVGYLFVRFPEHMLDHRGVPPFAVARACQGVKDTLRAINAQGEWEPFPVPDKAVAEFMRRQRNREFGRPRMENSKDRMVRLARVYVPGRDMRVAEGPFAEFTATIEALLAGGVVEATVVVFGRASRVTFQDPDKSLRTLAQTRKAA